MPKLPLLAALLMLPITMAAAAPRPGFHYGPVFPHDGEVASVPDSDMPIPPGTVFKVAFDITEQAKPGEISRAIDTAARFTNMLAEAGVPQKDIHIALVFHGPGAIDLLKPAAYAARTNGATNATAPLIAELAAKGVQFWLCGQSAAGQKIVKADVLPEVKMSLSAMVAFAMLQQQGYTVNPF
jgi:intracellular sulfur oxidation DsrE/DsrF family protein